MSAYKRGNALVCTKEHTHSHTNMDHNRKGRIGQGRAGQRQGKVEAEAGQGRIGQGRGKVEAGQGRTCKAMFILLG